MKNVFIGLLLFSMVLSLTAGAVTYPPDRPLYIGHRGAKALSDENTLESLKLAADMGVDMVEFDIQRTADGVFVLMHDETVDRTTDGTGRVDEMTVEEFLELKTESGYTPPTLEMTLDWLETTNISFILDFKIDKPEQARELIELVEDHGLLDRAVFESPVPEVAGIVEELRPEVVTAIYPTNMFFMRYYLDKYDVDIASYQYLFANLLEVWLAQEDGKRVMVWTVNSRFMVRWFEKIEVDGIMTDNPAYFKQED
ncbi:MAG: glycerophosphodiester phosphodiesterase family protein [bacterium]